MNVSIRRASFAVMYFVTSKFFTSPAICALKLVASKRVMRVTPERPSSALFQAVATSLPIGEMMPRPVMTTRRRPFMRGWWFPGCLRLLHMCADVVHCLLYGADLLGLFV